MNSVNVVVQRTLDTLHPLLKLSMRELKRPDKRGKDNVKEFFSGLRVLRETGINLGELSLTDNEMDSSTYFTQCIQVLAVKTAYFLTYFVTDLGTPMNGEKINKSYVLERTQFIKKAWNSLSKAREEATVLFNLAITVLLLELSDKTKTTTTTTPTTPDKSKNSLVKFRDSVRATIQFIPPHNKQTLITTIAMRYENDGKYLKLSTGSGQSEYTSKRVNIYEEETGGRLEMVGNQDKRVRLYPEVIVPPNSIVALVNILDSAAASATALADFLSVAALADLAASHDLLVASAAATSASELVKKRKRIIESNEEEKEEEARAVSLCKKLHTSKSNIENN